MNKKKAKELVKFLDDLGNKQRADIYKRKYLQEKELNNKIRKVVGL